MNKETIKKIKEQIKSKEFFVSNTSSEFFGLNTYLKLFKDCEYKYVVKVQDKFLSSWSPYAPKKHIHLIMCKDLEEMNNILYNSQNDKSLSYVTWNYLSNKEAIYSYTKNKTFTIRNDWRR